MVVDDGQVEDGQAVVVLADHPWRLPPLRRIVVVGVAAAVVSMAWHIAVAQTDESLGERLFPEPFGGLVYIEMSVPVGLAAILVVLAVLRVGMAPAVWVVGSPLAVGGALLAAIGLKILNPYTWEARLHIPGWLIYGPVDSAGVAVAFMLAAVLTDGRLPARIRVVVPAVVLAVVFVVWAIVYNVRYHPVVFIGGLATCPSGTPLTGR